MIAAIGSALSAMIGWLGQVVSAIVTTGDTPGALNALLPVFALFIAATLIMFAIKIIRGFTWGA